MAALPVVVACCLHDVSALITYRITPTLMMDAKFVWLQMVCTSCAEGIANACTLYPCHQRRPWAACKITSSCQTAPPWAAAG